MPNNLFQQLNPQAQQPKTSNINPNAVQSIKSMMGMFKGASNPQQLMGNLMSQNPQVASVMKMLNGRDPKTFFYEQCKQNGINPDDIINSIKQL